MAVARPGLKPAARISIQANVQARAAVLVLFSLPLTPRLMGKASPPPEILMSTSLPLVLAVGVGQCEEPGPLMARARFIRRKQGNVRYIQTSASLSSGSSGGGLFDERWRLIGITTFVVKGGGNLNFAVAVDEALDILSQVR